MNEPFQPLVPDSGSREPKNIKLTPLAPDHSKPGGAAAAPAQGAPGQSQPGDGGAAESVDDSGPGPRVTFKKEGDRVTHIVVRCSCGRIIELACDYRAG